ncbi:MAG: hypothetical protein LC130_23860 [Bryobacterales bacterium]|nr:hypothetical protein [Bryobacterales bacterium]
MISYSGVHIDGVLDCKSIQVGLLKAIPETPVAQVRIVAGIQKHPTWALDRLAVVVYAYVQTALRYGEEIIKINAHGTLVSNTLSSCVLLRSLTWHTSRTIRVEAERMIGNMTMPNGAPWPNAKEMTLPVDASLVESLRAVWNRYAA